MDKNLSIKARLLVQEKTINKRFMKNDIAVILGCYNTSITYVFDEMMKEGSLKRTEKKKTKGLTYLYWRVRNIKMPEVKQKAIIVKSTAPIDKFIYQKPICITKESLQNATHAGNFNNLGYIS